MRFAYMFFLFVVLMLFISGCIDGPTENGLQFSVSADSPRVFSGSTTSVYAEFENTETKTLNNVNIWVYHSGLLDIESGCSVSDDEVKPDDFLMMSSCVLSAPTKDEMASPKISTRVGFALGFTTTLSAVPVIEMVTEKEYQLRLNTGNWATGPKGYTYSDSNIEVKVEFSDSLPIIVREGKDAYIYFTIKNIGDGYLHDIKKDKITITEPEGSSSVVDTSCIPDGVLTSMGDSFPRIACKLTLPEDMEYLGNYVVVFNVEYEYEIRKDVSIDIIK